MRDEILSALRETEPDWLGSFRGAHDSFDSLEPSQPVNFGDEIVTGEFDSPFFQEPNDLDEQNTAIMNEEEDA